MLAVVLERKQVLSLRDIEIPETLGPHDVWIQVQTVGICGSDVHYYQHGSIGPFVVHEPMILGHEASGKIVEVGAEVEHLKPGDRVCMEPGIPNQNSKAAQLGLYHLDPNIQFWATPSVHGVLREFVVHPTAFTYKLPENVSYGEGAVVEPFAVGMHAANKAQIKPGDVAVVIGAGTIGICTALAALAGGCSKIIISDLLQDKLDFISKLGPIIPVNIRKNDLTKTVMELTDGWGADILFEASGSEVVTPTLFDPLAPAGRLVYIGHPANPKPLNIVAAQVKEIRIETIFRYAHVFPRILALMESGKIDLKPLITETYAFSDSIKAFEYAINRKPSSIKIQISFPD